MTTYYTTNTWTTGTNDAINSRRDALIDELIASEAPTHVPYEPPTLDNIRAMSAERDSQVTRMREQLIVDWLTSGTKDNLEDTEDNWI